MKTVIIFFLSISLLVLSSCSTDSNSVLENKIKRNELFNVIANDQNYMMEFMEVMNTNDHAMQMMQGNNMMMGKMMQGEGMSNLMNDNSMRMGAMHSMMENMEGRKMMMTGIMNDKQMMKSMTQMMYEEGTMSKACLDNYTKSVNK